MRRKKDYFEVGSTKALRQKYGLNAKNRPTVRLDKARIPQVLWPLIPDAELLGIADDLIRDDVWQHLPKNRRDKITARVNSFDAELDDWLGGREAQSSRPSPEYVAFSALRMTTDQ
jgi:hypothetical protein